MDNCKDNIEAISMLIDGELDEEQASELRAHISRCETCKKVYDAFSAISGSLGDDLVEPPEMLCKGIMFKVNLIENGGGKRRFAYGRFTAIAACLALILFGANHFGLMDGSNLGVSAKKSAEVAEAQVLEESMVADAAAPAGGEDTGKNLLDGFLEEFDRLNLTAADEASEPELPEEGRIAQFGVGSRPMDKLENEDAADKTDFLLFLDGLLAYADENDPENTAEDFAFYRSEDESEEDIPAQLRIYEGKLEKTAEVTSSNIFTNSIKKHAEPLATFADLETLRSLRELLKDAEETDKVFETDPTLTIALFDSEDKLMDDKVSPLLIWVHDGHIYFQTAPEAKIMRASIKPEEIAEFLESFKEVNDKNYVN